MEGFLRAMEEKVDVKEEEERRRRKGTDSAAVD